MREFNQLCKQIEELDPQTYAAVLGETAARVIPVLMDFTFVEDDVVYTGVDALADFVLASVVADGKLSAEEYLMILPLFNEFFGEYLDFEECQEIVKKCKSNNKYLKQYTDEMVDMFGLFSDDLKDSIIMICLMICAVDGKVSFFEKNWIKQLIK